MGSIRNGGNGAFSGKAGSFIGSSWRDINYIKGLPKLSTKPKSQKQLEQQAKFALAIQFLLPVKNQLSIGYGKVKQGRATSYNTALQRVLNNAITGVYPAYEINYPFVSFSHGSLSQPEAVTVVPQSNTLLLSWDNSVVGPNSNIGDLLTVLVYQPDSNSYVMGPPAVVRSSEAATIALPAHWLTKVVHIYMFYMSPETREVSPTYYAGSETVV
ncbi:MAG: DUF6266 family protein [Bacteroidota bacterium]